MTQTAERAEIKRSQLLENLEILNTNENRTYDDLTSLAASICKAPICIMTLLDGNTHFYKSTYGFDRNELPIKQALSRYVVDKKKTLLVEDKDNHPVFNRQPNLRTNTNFDFFIGIPLKLKEVSLGTLCLMDYRKRKLSKHQLDCLHIIATQIANQLCLRQRNLELQLLRERERELIEIVSHELRTPLTSIYGSLTILKSRKVPLDPHKKEHLIDVCQRNTEHLKNLVDDLLESSSLEKGPVKLNKDWHDINEIIIACMRKIEGFLKRCKVTVEMKLERSIPRTKVDEFRISQVINNLISNAAKFSPPHSKIHIETIEIDDHFRIIVRDFGQGIPEDKQNQIFRKFSKFGQTKENLPGTGLGLYITKLLVDAHFGKISFESRKNIGTTFIVDIPIIKKTGISQLVTGGPNP